jgi:hypothetical protein
MGTDRERVGDIETTAEIDDPNERSDDPRVRSRAEKLLPEEKTTGSHDPVALAQAVLAESDGRQEDREAPAGGTVEHRRSQDTVDPT